MINGKKVNQENDLIIKHIVADQEKTDTGSDAALNLVALVPIDLRFGEECTPLKFPVYASQDVSIGDIVDMDMSTGKYSKISYSDCKPAIVIGADIIFAGTRIVALKQIVFFNKEFGQQSIILEHKDRFFYTKCGDEVLVSKNGDKNYEIITNKTVDKMRSDFLIKQK